LQRAPIGHYGRRPWRAFETSPISPAFETTSKRRKGFPSETRVKRGLRFVHGDVELVEKLGRNDPCPCGSALSFQALLLSLRLLSTERGATIIGAIERASRRAREAA
jgi:hypothetical protein